ncbi:hypothetical protein E3N88_17806 [Mikania micrantha]|uniref:Uncharacterized protein n=1 Tax=Mikania micrantha TaxID=192012 RepID=A0A5N6NUB8_9ASTR|nr:hypothetical protein E3N88_17806 [Mikania micrantha]
MELNQGFVALRVAGNKLLVASSGGMLMMMSSKLLFQAPMASPSFKASKMEFSWWNNGDTEVLARDWGASPDVSLRHQAYRADAPHPATSFPSRAYRLGQPVGLRRTAWASRQAQ